MDNLAQRLARARADNIELNTLMTEYLPFIKSEAAKTTIFGLDYDDRLSIAMLVFMNCVRSYEEQRGAFLPFAAVCIRNRLIDEGRKRQRQQEKLIQLHPEEEAQVDANASMQAYSIAQERTSLAEEIDRLSATLLDFGIALSALSEICPKQKRSRALCVRLAQETARDAALRRSLLEHRRLPLAALAGRFAISEKTVEKHRKYIVTIAVILSGDYPGIRAFLPDAEEVK